MTLQEKFEKIDGMRRKYWSTSRHESHDQQSPTKPAHGSSHGSSHGSPHGSSQGPSQEPSSSSFVYRSSVKSCVTPLNNGVDFVPKNATALTDHLRELYQIKEDDYFSILYGNSQTMLSAFKEDLLEKGLLPDRAQNHIANIQVIWQSLSSKMEMFPRHPFSNLHLLKKCYHAPNFKVMGTEKGVQSGTLRARYSSMAQFIQFVRRNQIFAGMSRQDLHFIEDAISDFNKCLTPFIKQRKVDVRRQKARNLLLPSHFIAYGKSPHIQNFLRLPNLKQMLTKSTAVQFRDFLMTSFVIGNGLRASNVINLSLKDIEEAKEVNGYPGHKVITNSSYKTSTIYGEKFVVVPESIFALTMYYIQHLRPKLNATKSKKLFLPNSDSAELSSTNVSSSLTASFKRACILDETEQQRVSCTRIRCGIATYACNDGGIDEAFFAKHFMKNREETTALHYNLHSNRRHALNIAMELYSSFSTGGDKVAVNSKEIADKISESCRNITASTVVDWLKKNTEIEGNEMAEFKEMLEEIGKTNCQSFYTKVTSFMDKKNLILCFVLKIKSLKPKDLFFSTLCDIKNTAKLRLMGSFLTIIPKYIMLLLLE